MNANVYNAIECERARQDEKWGKAVHADLYWLGILTEEVGEVAKALIEGLEPFEEIVIEDEQMVAEVIRVAAVAVAWLEAVQERQLDTGEAKTAARKRIAGDGLALWEDVDEDQ